MTIEKETNRDHREDKKERGEHDQTFELLWRIIEHGLFLFATRPRYLAKVKIWLRALPIRVFT